MIKHDFIFQKSHIFLSCIENGIGIGVFKSEDSVFSGRQIIQFKISVWIGIGDVVRFLAVIHRVFYLIKSDYQIFFLGFGFFIRNQRFYFSADVQIVNFISCGKSEIVIFKGVSFVIIHNRISKIETVCCVGLKRIVPFNQQIFIGHSRGKNFLHFFDGRRNNEVFIDFFQGNIFIKINAEFANISGNIHS